MIETELNKSLKERVFHSILFEVLANILIALMLAMLLSVPVTQSAVLAALSAITAMLWNVIFNRAFDAVQKRVGFKRNLWARILHAVLFEAGLLAVLIPFAAWWFAISLAKAFVLEIGLVAFFLPYTLAFNYLYDFFRFHWVNLYRGAER
ncbi:PACE efflux transporter [Kalamiella sp. sgz302252]|uniref:PACE efflux transporter n=1 Tax=Pantoea sp. sgz302252 TaxID=3341827 RepID=UPI0036D3E533